jgi:hypothetical protein
MISHGERRKEGWMDGRTLVSLFCFWMGFWMCGFGERFCQLFVILETKNERREEDNRASKKCRVMCRQVNCTMGWSQGAFILGTLCSAEGVTRHHEVSGQIFFGKLLHPCDISGGYLAGKIRKEEREEKKM